MGARDRWIEIAEDGRILMHSENDGCTYLNRGPERETEVVTIEYLERHYSYLARQAKELLERKKPKS